MSDSGLTRFLKEHKEKLNPLLVLTHDYPDPDALASAFALTYLAEQLAGIHGKIVHGGVIGRSENREMARLLKIPAHKLQTSDLSHFAGIALVDTQPIFDNNSFPATRKASLVIDQHPSDEPPNAEFVLIDTEAAATSALLARELLASNLAIPAPLATALVYGILSDTLNFFRVTNRETIELYLRLLHRADIRMLARIQNPPRPRKFFRDLAAGIEKAWAQGTLIVTHLGPTEFPDHISQMADFLLTCEGIQWAFCTGWHGEFLHMSLRTNLPDGQAVVILRAICDNPRQAGGHGQIAGGKVNLAAMNEKSRWKSTQEFTRRLINQLDKGRRGRITPLIASGPVGLMPQQKRRS